MLNLYRIAQTVIKTVTQTPADSTMTNSLSGHHHQNVRVDTPTGLVNVRIPRTQAILPDLRIWAEAEILSAVGAHLEEVPRVLFISEDPRFQVQEFITGATLKQLAPYGTEVPEHVQRDTVALLSCLVTIPREDLPALPPSWPKENSIAFARNLSSWTLQTYRHFVETYGSLFAALDIPVQPLAPLFDLLPALGNRQSACLHGDLHRGNIMVAQEKCVFLDWELALWGDPLYDLAIHLTKMRYLPREEERLLSLWSAALPTSHTSDWEQDLPVYLAHEHIKFALNDTVRYAQTLCNPTVSPSSTATMLTGITRKLNAAYFYWNGRTSIEESELAAIVQHWLTRQGAS